MTLEKIGNHITGKAQVEADEITSTTRAECGKIVAEARAEAETEFEGAITRLKAELANEFDHAVGKVQSDHRRVLLEERTRILNEVFKKATEKLLHHSAFWTLTKRHLGEVAGLDGKIRCRAEHRDTIARVAGEVANETGKTLPPVSDPPVGILGGFVLESDRYDLDYSLDTQIETFRERTLTGLLQEAFSTP